MSDAESINNQDAVNKLKQKDSKAAPWALTFSFGRALQGVATQAWADGKSEESQNV